MDKKQQVRYNFRRSKRNEECLEWFFLIVNQNREIEEIKNRIYYLFAPIEEESVPIVGVVKGNRLKYELINFESRKKVELYNFKRFIFKRIIKDAKLYHREDVDGLANYLIGQLEK